MATMPTAGREGSRTVVLSGRSDSIQQDFSVAIGNELSWFPAPQSDDGTNASAGWAKATDAAVPKGPCRSNNVALPVATPSVP